ncbi:bifunctional Autophagy protein Atg8 ubiquitin-like/Ubiquitin-like domain superfamily [Babesia duncani]|uniref:Autophagy-related protein n=1 Tax=Babesia duncani TaxID=323732 RepID=A0AAD9UP01_9APIC|nr:bifunctional Autophagy protein Atg8 ubiquitin-like/Ubiquitin-like domain superfamily [Babesia duncani]
MATFSEDEYAEPTERQTEVMRLRAKFNDRIPVICTPMKNNLNGTCSKFLVPDNMMYGEFKYVLQKHLYCQINTSLNRSDHNTTLYLYVDNKVPKIATLMEDLYRKFSASDGILYMSYSNENALG